MASSFSPEQYEAWYHSPRGQWIGDLEFSLLQNLLQAEAGNTLLDVGCGTGYFSRRFRQSGLRVTGLDPDPLMLEYARRQSADIEHHQGLMENLPYASNSFDYVSAVTSLCFVNALEQAVQEMWRVATKGVVLGLLNRHSLLYRQKHDIGSYRGARWDTCSDARQWATQLLSGPRRQTCQSAVFLPGGGYMARVIERCLSPHLPWGGFMAVCYMK